MPQFRKLPVVIEATRLATNIQIATREGDLIGSPGDWLVAGVGGEQYPCSDHIFRLTYEPVDDAARAAFEAVAQ